MLVNVRIVINSFLSCLIAGCILFPASVRAQVTVQSGAVQSAPDNRYKEWAIPNAQAVRTCTSGTLLVSDFISQKSFDEVWTFYAKKLQVPQKYVGGESRTDYSDDRQRIVLNSSADPSQGLISMRSGIRSSTFVLRSNTVTVVVFISRGKTEKVTHFTLFIEPR